MEPQSVARATTSPSLFDRFPPAPTRPAQAAQRRKLAMWSSALAIPVAGAIGTLLGSRRTGVIAGAVAALGVGALRWQLARWFTPTPAYTPTARHGELEVRRYAARIEARTEVAASDLEQAHDRGYGRLACFLFGVNGGAEVLPMCTPVLTTMRDGVYATSFAMPPERALAALPQPSDVRVELREVPAAEVAVYRFTGRTTPEILAHHERRFLRALLDAGLVARGSITLASYDSPFTLPALRRNELWIEIA